MQYQNDFRYGKSDTITSSLWFLKGLTRCSLIALSCTTLPPDIKSDVNAFFWYVLNHDLLGVFVLPESDASAHIFEIVA